MSRDPGNVAVTNIETERVEIKGKFGVQQIFYSTTVIELTSWLLLSVGGQRSEAQINVTREGGAGTEVGAARCGSRACPGRGTPDLTAGAAAE